MRSFYGVHDTYGASPRQTRNLSGYPGVMEEEYIAKDQWSDFSDEEKAEVLDVLGKDGDIILKNEKKRHYKIS